MALPIFPIFTELIFYPDVGGFLPVKLLDYSNTVPLVCILTNLSKIDCQCLGLRAGFMQILCKFRDVDLSVFGGFYFICEH